MRLLDSLTLRHGNETRTIALYQGDLSAIPPEERVDILVTSAFRDNYLPTRHALIGALHRRGIYVSQLARNKQTDLRDFSSCWLSKPVFTGDDPGFTRILCFEPLSPHRAPEVIGDVFRSLIALINQPTTVAMPLVSSGYMGIAIEEMLPVLLDAAVQWMALGLNVTTLKIVENSTWKAEEMRVLFSAWKARYAEATKEQATVGASLHTAAPSSFRYDVFISYCQKNSSPVDVFVDALKAARPGIRIFMDRLELNPSAAWQQAIYDALDDCARIVAFYTPEYLDSDICKEELNIAILRQRLTKKDVLYPIYLHTANLPTYLLARQYVDCLEGDIDKLCRAAQDLAARFSG
jgi:hypothetical protein